MPSLVSNIPVWKEFTFKSQLSLMDTKNMALWLLDVYNQATPNMTNQDFVLDFLRNVKANQRIISSVLSSYSEFG